MDQKAIDEREAISWMLDELESIDLSKRPKTADFILSLRNQYDRRLSLSPGQFEKLKQIFEELTDVY